MKSFVFLLIFLSSSFVCASCWTGVLPGQYAKMLDCSYLDWKNHPQDETIQPFLKNLFYVYFTDGANKTIHQFFDEMRYGSATDLIDLRNRLITKYEPYLNQEEETPAISGLPQNDAAILFVLSQTDPSSLSPEITRNVFITVYSEIDSLFVLNLATSGQFGVLPHEEYLRILEIVKRMSWMPDPFLKAMNHYFQGILLMHLHDVDNGRLLLEQSRQEFAHCLNDAKSQLSKKRILFHLGDDLLVCGHQQEAIGEYISILKMDPQDWDALMMLSKILYQTGQCADPGVWVEASMTSKQKEFQLTIHCGNKEMPEEDLEDSAPVVAFVPLRLVIFSLVGLPS